MTIQIFKAIPDLSESGGSCDIMALAAHPDDIEFGGAGTIASCISEGMTAVYALATNGDKGTGDRSLSTSELIKIRQQEQAEAAEVVGVDRIVYLGYPDQGLEETAEFRKDIVRLLRIFRPRILMTSDPYKRYLWHRDHRVLGQVAMDAVFPYARDHLAYADLLEQGLEPHKVSEVLFWGAEDINHYVDISRSFELKEKALRCHRSQIAGFSSQDPFARLRKQCQNVAKDVEYQLAEGFHRITLPA